MNHKVSTIPAPSDPTSAILDCGHLPLNHRTLDIICLTCLRREPERRYATAAEVANELRSVLDRERWRGSVSHVLLSVSRIYH